MSAEWQALKIVGSGRQAILAPGNWVIAIDE